MRGPRAWLVAMAFLATSSVASAQEPAPPPRPAEPSRAAEAPRAPEPPAPADVKLDLVLGELKMLALDDVKAWSVLPEGGISARAVDDGHTLRLVAQKDGTYRIRLERNDGTVVSYVVHVGAAPTPPVPVPIGAPLPVDPNAPKPIAQSADEKYSRNTLDLNFEGGIGRHFGDPAKTFGFGRARAGVMFARWPVFTMIGATYEYNTLSPATFGVQGELLQLSGGVWGQLGAMLDTHGKPGAMLSLGISIIGVEAQYRVYEDNDKRSIDGVAVLGKLRLPLGVILYAFDLNKKR